MSDHDRRATFPMLAVSPARPVKSTSSSDLPLRDIGDDLEANNVIIAEARGRAITAQPRRGSDKKHETRRSGLAARLLVPQRACLNWTSSRSLHAPSTGPWAQLFCLRKGSPDCNIAKDAYAYNGQRANDAMQPPLPSPSTSWLIRSRFARFYHQPLPTWSRSKCTHDSMTPTESTMNNRNPCPFIVCSAFSADAFGLETDKT